MTTLFFTDTSLLKNRAIALDKCGSSHVMEDHYYIPTYRATIAIFQHQSHWKLFILRMLHFIF